MKTLNGIQICPFGEYPSGNLTQICDRAAFEALIANFNPEIVYVDREHWGEDITKGDTSAAAWVKRLYIHDTDGLLSDWELTPLGEDLILTKKLRYLSPVWYLDEANRPNFLKSIGLTNTPNIPVRPIQNKVTDSRGVATVPGVFALKLPLQNKDKVMDPAVLQELGLPAEGTPADVVAAIKKLKEAAQTAEDGKLMVEAENVCKNKHVAEKDQAEFKAEFVKNKGMLTLAMANKFGNPPAPERVVQPGLAKTPDVTKNKAGSHEAILNKYNEIPEGDEKNAYLLKHSNEIAAATVAAAKKGE